LHFLLIENPLDPRLDDFRNVPDAELIRRRGIFVAEGRLVVRRLLTESPLVTRAVMLTDTARESMQDIIASRPDLPVHIVPQNVMDSVAGFRIHRGCLAIGEYPRPRPWQQIITLARTVLVLERIANADNVGGIFRCAAAFGADALLLDPVTTDPLYRKAIRTSMGAALVVPFARAEPWPAALGALRTGGFLVVAMTPAPSAPALSAIVKTAAERRVALVFGHEGDGLSEAALAACEYHARIPVTSKVDSLNVAAAAAIALYDLTRHDTSATASSRAGFVESGFTMPSLCRLGRGDQNR
jgi:tRNA G18 (ribose-2'-O)-methylase SpoU